MKLVKLIASGEDVIIGPFVDDGSAGDFCEILDMMSGEDSEIQKFIGSPIDPVEFLLKIMTPDERERFAEFVAKSEGGVN